VCSGIPDTLRFNALSQSRHAMARIYEPRRRSAELDELALAITASMQTLATKQRGDVFNAVYFDPFSPTLSSTVLLLQR
jgi:hypothetical protein